MSPACGAAGREGRPHPLPRPAKEPFAELLVPLWPYGRVGSDFWKRPSFYLHGQFRVPSSPAPLVPGARSRPTAAPPGARCDVTPAEGAGEWNGRERLLPGAQGHSYELTEPRTAEGKEGGKGFFKRENRWEKSCGVEAKFVFWLEVWSGSNLLSLCASCPSGSCAAVPSRGTGTPRQSGDRGGGV